VADGVARVDGLSEVMYNEMVQFPGNAIGSRSLEEDEVGCVVLGDVSALREGPGSTTGKLLSVPVGKSLLGRVVDALGARSTAGSARCHRVLSSRKNRPWHHRPQIVSQPVLTGIMAMIR